MNPLFVFLLQLAIVHAHAATVPYQEGSCREIRKMREELITFRSRFDKTAFAVPVVEKSASGCRLRIDGFVPEVIAKKKSAGFGAKTLINCHGATAFFAGLQDRLEAVTNLPVSFLELCSKVSRPQAGDLGVFFAAKGEPLHSFTYLTPDFILQSPGMALGEYPKVDSLVSTKNSWSPHRLEFLRCDFRAAPCNESTVSPKSVEASSGCHCAVEPGSLKNLRETSNAMLTCSEGAREAQQIAHELKALTQTLLKSNLEDAARIARSEIPALSKLYRRLFDQAGKDRRACALASFEVIKLFDAFNAVAQTNAHRYPSADLEDLERGTVIRMKGAGTGSPPDPTPAEAKRSVDVAYCLLVRAYPADQAAAKRCVKLRESLSAN